MPDPAPGTDRLSARIAVLEELKGFLARVAAFDRRLLRQVLEDAVTDLTLDHVAGLAAGRAAERAAAPEDDPEDDREADASLPPPDPPRRPGKPGDGARALLAVLVASPGGRTTPELGRALGVRQPTVIKLVRRLEAAGCIRRTVDPRLPGQGRAAHRWRLVPGAASPPRRREPDHVAAFTAQFLAAVAAEPGRTTSELAERLGSTTSRTLKQGRRLAANGRVRFQARPDDRRGRPAFVWYATDPTPQETP